MAERDLWVDPAHGGHHVTQINEVQSKNFSAEAKTWESMKQHMYVLSDALVEGIAKSFQTSFNMQLTTF